MRHVSPSPIDATQQKARISSPHGVNKMPACHSSEWSSTNVRTGSTLQYTPPAPVRSKYVIALSDCRSIVRRHGHRLRNVSDSWPSDVLPELAVVPASLSWAPAAPTCRGGDLAAASAPNILSLSLSCADVKHEEVKFVGYFRWS